MLKESRKRRIIESVNEADEATSPKQSCLYDSHEAETSQNDDLLKLQYEAESLMPATGIVDYCTEKILLYMYKLDVSTWCYLKRRAQEDKLQGVGLTLDITVIDKFSDIVIKQNDEFIHVNVNYTVSPFADKFITYLDLFGTKSPYSLNNYFNSWVSYVLNQPNYQSSKVKYLVVFCNGKLQLSEDDKLVLCSSKNSYPFQFESVDISRVPVLQDMLVTNTACKFHKFATDKLTIDEFCQRLMLSSRNQKILKNKCLTAAFEEDLKKRFQTKIIILDNQPCRESYKKILKHEIERYNKDYVKLQNRLVKYTSIAKKSTCDENFKLIMSVLNDMFIHEKISAVNTKSYFQSNVINILYKSKITYLINLGSAKNASISFEDFFPHNKNENSKFALNDLYNFFRNEYRKSSNIKFFIIYTYSELNLTHNNKITSKKSEEYYPFQLNNVDLFKKRYKVIKNCTALNKSMFYEFAPEDYSALSKLLNHPNSNEQDINAEDEEDLKSLFFHCLILATGQEKIIDITRQNEQQLWVPYSIDELQEITLRWLEFQKHQIMTLRHMRVILNEIRNLRSSCKYLNYFDVSDEWKLSKTLSCSVPSRRNEIFNYLINGKGKMFIQHFKNARINVSSITTVLTGTLERHIYLALEALHNFWFDEKGNKTQNFLLLEKNHLNIKTLFSIACVSNIKAVNVIQSLYNLWFDDLGCKTKYLSSFEKEGIGLSVLGTMIHGSTHNTRLAYENLYNLWFDEHGEKTKYLRNFQKNNLPISKIADILNGSGISCAQTIRDLHDLWFDTEGNKTKYLLALQNHNIDYNDFLKSLCGSRTQAVHFYKKLYYVLFDENGNPNQKLQYLKNAGVKFSIIFKLFKGSRKNIVDVIDELCNIFFDEDGNKSKYLINLENHGINIEDICRIIWGVPTKASTIFKDVYNFLFDEEGNKKTILRTFENYGISLKYLAKVLEHSNVRAIKVMTDLANLWFDENGNKSYYLKHLENNGMDLIKILKYLRSSLSGAANFFQALYGFFIDENGMASFHLNTLKKYESSVDIFMKFIECSSNDHNKYINRVFYLFFDKEGNKTQLLSNFESKDVDLTLLSTTFVFCRGRGIKEFHDLFFDEMGQDSEMLKSLERKNVRLFDVCNIYHKTGAKTPFYFKMLFELWFDEDFKETPYIQHMERNGVPLAWLCQIIKGSRLHACKAFKAIYQLFIDENGYANFILQNTTKYINLKKIQKIFPFGRMNFPTNFSKLYNCWFDEKGEKTHVLHIMERNNFDVNIICDILKGSCGYAAKSFDSLYKLLFDPEGNPSSYIINYLNNPAIIKSVSKIIRGTRGKIVTLLKSLYTLWFKPDGGKKKLLLTLENYGVDFVTLHGIFIGVLETAYKPFMELYKCMFKSTAKPTESVYLKSLLEIGFTLTDIIVALRKSGPNAATNFMNIYQLFFNEQRQMTRYTEVLMQNQVDIASFVRGLHVKNGNKFVDIFKCAYGLYFDENGVKIDQMDNKEYVSNIVHSEIRH
ncbi:hypothetical protein TKK_0016802 [Trichogramma kaykai]|uniref:Uncharacterized protein n=2 Tax=Trichogramma kaykai TaxID=54128 RepID=A0ABD2W4T4_9HYME